MALPNGNPTAGRISAVVPSRLRARRELLGISARSLAQQIAVSPSLVSQIETGKANPSVATLFALVNALGMSLDELFADAGDSGAADADGAVDGSARAGGRRRPGSPRVLRGERRSAISLASGVRWERLTPSADPEVDFLFVTYDVGGESCPPDALMRHHGREYGLVLSGMLGATIGFDSYELRPGDSIVLPSTTPHRFWTIGEQPAVLVWTVVGRAGDERPRFRG